ncbi:MAG: peptide ABC transporter substrate-binding protein [Anaerolineaceae bacterium]|nr:MAG: peptide ABC transporter substrate-binding protein [Anaerolineaceae bacterium]
MEERTVNKKLFALLSVLVLASMILVACGPKPTDAPATEAPMTEAPATEVPATEAPTAEPTPVPDVPIATYDGTTLSVPDCDYGGWFKSIEATDPSTVTFTLCKPDPAFIQKIAFSVFGIYPKEWLEATAGETGRTSEGLEKPVGTGPYMVSEWARGDSITFVANPNYWGAAPEAETLVFRWSTESAARLLELQAGTIDGFDNVGPDDFATIEGDSNLHLQIRPALNIFYVGMTNTFPPFDDVRVRQAVAMGIDRQRIVDTFYPRGSEVASHFTPCAIPNACEGEAWYEFDPEAGRALLAEAGYPDGFKTSLYYRDVVRGYLPQVGNVAQDIQAQLKENLNIDAEIVVMESGAFIEESAAGRLNGFHLLGWGADYPHVTNFLDYHFGKEVLQFGALDPSIYEPLIEGAQIADPVAAAPFYEQANNAIRELVPMVPIAHGGSAAAYRADVTNPQASPLTTELFAFSDPGGRDVFVWMQNAEPISMFCADETDGESLRACEQVIEALYGFEPNSAVPVPHLAESCVPNEDLTVWTCTLRQGVKFHDGSDFDSTDVVATFNMGLNIGAPTHVGNTNLWDYYAYLWGLMSKPGE